MTNFTIGQHQKLVADDEMSLLTGIEGAIDFCLDVGDVFATFAWKWDFCQLALDATGDMHVESSYGALVKHAGFTDRVEGFPWLRGNRLPAAWHARAKMAAGAMTRAFIDAGKITFPVELEVTILKNSPAKTSERQAAIEGAASIGFTFAEDRPIGDFATGLAPQLELDPANASIADVMNKIQATIESSVGPLNRESEHPIDADYVVELARDQFTIHNNRG